jgi:hypothetical protein
VNAAECAVSQNITSTRPDPHGVPTKVAVGIYIIDVSEINDVSQIYHVDFFFTLNWSDPRLSSKMHRTSSEMCTYKLDEIWHPHINIVNQRDIKKAFDDIVEVDKEGNVLYRQRLYGTLTSPLDLRDFPFDKQALPISIASFRYGPEEVTLVIDEQRTGRVETFSLQGWSLTLGETQIKTEYIKPQDRNLSRLDAHLVAQRHVGFYLLKVLLPFALIVFMAGTVFLIDPTETGPQVGISTASVLTLIAFQFSLGYHLPKISYITQADRFAFGSTILVFLALGEAIITARLAKKGKEKLARKIDYYALVIYIILFAIVALITFKN